MKQRSITGTLARNTAIGMAVFWLLSMVLTTWLLAGEISARMEPMFLEKLSQELNTAAAQYDSGSIRSFSVSEESEEPVTVSHQMLLLAETEMPVYAGIFVLDSDGVTETVSGFDIGNFEPTSCSLTVDRGILALCHVSDVTDSKPGKQNTVFALRLSDAPPSAAGFWAIIQDGKEITQTASGSTSMELLDGIENGTYRFGSRRPGLSTVLLGKWITNAEGEKSWFLIGAYGWSPLAAAVKSLILVYVLTLLLCELLGTFVWRSFDRSISLPLRRLGGALKADPLAVSKAEDDCAMAYWELQAVLAGYRLRDQLRQAGWATDRFSRPLEDAAAKLSEAILRAEEKLGSAFMSWTQNVVNDFQADGYTGATEAAMDGVLIAMFQEAAPYLKEKATVTVRTRELSGFYLTELEGPIDRRVGKLDLDQLWDGFHRGSASGVYAGSGLRKALWEIPSGFSSVERTKNGLLFRVGVPVGSNTGGRGSHGASARTDQSLLQQKSGKAAFGMDDLDSMKHPRARKLERILIPILVVLALLVFVALSIWLKGGERVRWQR